MLTKAAPMAPITAAALPPPGVEDLLASSSKKVWTGLSLIIRLPLEPVCERCGKTGHCKALKGDGPRPRRLAGVAAVAAPWPLGYFIAFFVPRLRGLPFYRNSA